VRSLCEICEAHGRVDVIAEDGFRHGHISGEHGFDSFSKKRTSKFGITLDASANGLFEIATQGHGTFSYFLRL
jgi:hypothetical protein